MGGQAGKDAEVSELALQTSTQDLTGVWQGSSVRCFLAWLEVQSSTSVGHTVSICWLEAPNGLALCAGPCQFFKTNQLLLLLLQSPSLRCGWRPSPTAAATASWLMRWQPWRASSTQCGAARWPWWSTSLSEHLGLV